jgi:hypothetical protein
MNDKMYKAHQQNHIAVEEVELFMPFRGSLGGRHVSWSRSQNSLRQSIQGVHSI